jgi:hypothetical protein
MMMNFKAVLLLALALAVLGMVSPVACFSPAHQRVTTTARSQRSLSPFGLEREEHKAPSVILYSSDKERKSRSETGETDPTGLRRGVVLLPLAVLVAVWLFTIPVEFRRAQFCSEEQVRLNPNSKCITPDNWVKGIQDYYQQGGGIDFDFTIDQDNTGYFSNERR